MDRDRSSLYDKNDRNYFQQTHIYRESIYSIQIMENPPGYQISIDGKLTRDVRDDKFKTVDLKGVFQIAHDHAKKLLDSTFSRKTEPSFRVALHWTKENAADGRSR